MKKLFFFILTDLIATPACTMHLEKPKALDLKMQQVPVFGKVTLQCQDGHLVVDNTKLVKLKTLYDCYQDCRTSIIQVDAKKNIIKLLLADNLSIPTDKFLPELLLVADKYEAPEETIRKLSILEAADQNTILERIHRIKDYFLLSTAIFLFSKGLNYISKRK